MNHEIYIRRCIELAQNALGQTYPNPMVGSVIVHNGKIIGEGYHRNAGGPHAEINAINSVENPELLPESTIYVSLEPCAHFGRTPPCAHKIIETGFKKVVIGARDSHEKVNGRGIQLLQDAGIEVMSGVLEEECKALNKRFFTFHQKKRPYIVLKWAESADGFIDHDFKPVSIGNSLSKQLVHTMRRQEHAIMVGTQTALNDNPSLTTREIYGRNPVRILTDFDLKVPSTFSIFNDQAETLIINSIKNSSEGNLHWIQTGKNDFLTHLMQALYERQIQSVLVEGGSFTLQQFIDAGLWDEILVIKNRELTLKNGTRAPQLSAEVSEIQQLRANILHFYRRHEA